MAIDAMETDAIFIAKSKRDLHAQPLSLEGVIVRKDAAMGYFQVQGRNEMMAMRSMEMDVMMNVLLKLIIRELRSQVNRVFELLLEEMGIGMEVWARNEMILTRWIMMGEISYDRLSLISFEKKILIQILMNEDLNIFPLS